MCALRCANVKGTREAVGYSLDDVSRVFPRWPLLFRGGWCVCP